MSGFHEETQVNSIPNGNDFCTVTQINISGESAHEIKLLLDKIVNLTILAIILIIAILYSVSWNIHLAIDRIKLAL